MYRVEKVTTPVVLGEGPHWDERQQALFFVGIPEHSIHKYVPATGEHTKTTLDGPPGFIVPVEGEPDQFVVGVYRTFQIIEWDGAENGPVRVVKVLGDVDPGTQNRINDGKADPRGRLFAGTIGYAEPAGNVQLGQGSLFRLEGGQIDRVAENVSISNGLAWDLPGKAFYYTDSLEYSIRRYDYDVETGAISRPTHIFDLRKNNIEGMPDGTTIDTDGNLWVAVFNGACVLKIDPRTGKLLQKVSLEAKQVTSVTFGGPDHSALYVTTASTAFGTDQLPPPGGDTLVITGLGVRGHPNVHFKL